MRYIAEDATLRFKFTTRRFSTGAPFTLAGTPSLSVYPEDSDTQVTAGITLTADYDSKTGLNNVVIDLSASASYAAGKAYQVVIEAGTVDSVSVVGEVVYEFYIHASGGLEALITRGLLALPAAAADAAGGLIISDAGGLDADAQRTDVAAILVDTAEIGAAGAGLTAINLPNQTINITGNLSGSVGSVSGNVGGIAGTITTLDALDTAQDTQHATTQSMLRGLILTQGTIGATGNDTTHLHLDGLAYGDDGPNDHLLIFFDNSTSLYYARWIEDFANTGDLATLASALPVTPENSVDTYWITSIRRDVTAQATVDLAAFFTTDSGETYASAVAGSVVKEIADNAGGSALTVEAIADGVWDEVASGHTTNGTYGKAFSGATNVFLASGIAGTINTLDALDTAQDSQHSTTQSRLPAALVNSRMDCTIDGTGMESGAVDAILNRDASASTTNSTLGAIINDWENGGRLDLILDGIYNNAAALVTGAATVNDASATATSFVTTLTGTAGRYNDQVIVFTSGATQGQARPIANLAADGTITVDEALTTAPTNGATFNIIATHVHPVSQIADGVFDEATSGHTTAGTFGKAISDILVDTAEIGAAGAGLTDLPDQTMNITGNITGNLSGSVGSLATQAKADVNAEVDTALGDYDGPTNAEMVAAFADLPTAAENATAVLAEAYEGSETFQDFLRLARAALVGKVSGMDANAPVFRDAADSKDRITATTDADGNRSAVTVDAS